MEELVENKHILPCISLREKHPNTVLINTGNFFQKKNSICQIISRIRMHHPSRYRKQDI